MFKDKLKATLSSRKFWAALTASAACVAAAFSNHDPLTVNLIMTCAGPLLGWATLEGLKDAAAASAKPAPVEPPREIITLPDGRKVVEVVQSP